MRRFVEGIDRGQVTLFPECLADWIDENNPVRVIDAFVDKLDLSKLGFEGVAPEATGRPSTTRRVPTLMTKRFYTTKTHKRHLRPPITALQKIYSITSSAVASNDGGTVRPSALAVVRLMTRSNLVGCSTGMSAGFAPRRILST
jgi:hypothetical protein